MFIHKFWCRTHCKEKLASIIIRSSICHGNQSSSNKSESLMKFILKVFRHKHIYGSFQKYTCISKNLYTRIPSHNALLYLNCKLKFKVAFGLLASTSN
jgi:hypothetical protein